MSDVIQAVEVILQNKCHSKSFHCRVFWLQEYQLRLSVALLKIMLKDIYLHVPKYLFQETSILHIDVNLEVYAESEMD